ncbi:hypothetical protein [Zhongshania marina]|uniref:hypothetical protein n=1 Tax=Zhongshania marina TaxID=2304603 RepID=UPI0011AF0DD8|nr:hypothetical protein [Marortus luteolus]
MKYLTLTMTILLFSIASGCAANQHTYTKDGMCLSCVNNPITGAPLNYDPEVDSQYNRGQVVTTAQEPTHSAGSISFQVDYDVEHTYYVVQREFSLPVPRHESNFNQAHRDPIDPEMSRQRHRVFDQPGSFRYAQAFRQHGDLYLVIGVKIAKVDHRTSKVTVSYLSDDPSQKVWDLARSLRERVRSALEYYRCDNNINRDYDRGYRYSGPC